MRHKKTTKKLNVKQGARKALIANMAESLVLYEKVQTSTARAKAVASFVEKLITKAKKQNLTARRELISLLYTQNAVKKLMEVLAPRYKDRAGGFTRITAVKNRVGDGAKEVVVELV